MNKQLENQINNSDLGNMKRFIEQSDGSLYYLAEKKKWIHFNGKCWSLENSEKVVSEFAEKTIHSIYEEATNAETKDEREKLSKHALSSESSRSIKAMINMAQSNLIINSDVFDQDLMLLNVANGTIDLNTGQLLAHDRNQLISKIINVNYDPQAKCPKWLDFLNLIMNGNSEMLTYIQRVIGYCLTGKTGERCFFILYGDGRNGKSTFTENVAYLLGDYATHTASEALLQKRFGEGISSDLARLNGARFVYASETAKNRKLNEARIKSLTGDKDTITARFLFCNEFSYTPIFKVFLHTNHKPTISGTEQAMWDRIRLIPFEVRIPDEQIKYRDEIDAIFETERPGILAWAVQGCLDWQKYGLGNPEIVCKATGMYKDESDPLKEFIEEVCIIDPSLYITKASLFSAYEQFCFKNGDQDHIKSREFNDIIKKEFEDFRETTGDKKMCWRGISISVKENLFDLKKLNRKT